MNGSNDLLGDDQLRAELTTQVHPKLIRARFDGFTEDLANPTFYFTWNNAQMFALLAAFLVSVDWDNGASTTVAEARKAVFGDGPKVQEYEEEFNAIARRWFTDRSDFNRDKSSGAWIYLREESTGIVHRFNPVEAAKALQRKAFRHSLREMDTTTGKAVTRNYRGTRAAVLLLENYEGDDALEALAELESGHDEFATNAAKMLSKWLALGPGGSSNGG